MTDTGGHNTNGRRHPDRLHPRTPRPHPLDPGPHLTPPIPIHRAHLHHQIATKQHHQTMRRAHVAELQALIDRHDLEISNLQTQLHNTADTTND